MGLGIGKALNSITGASESAKQANRYNYDLAQMSYQQQKEFAQNAHQWEMQDLQKAGLNPALTTGASSAGSIASGGSTGGGGSPGNGMDIFSILSGVVNQTRATSANNKNLKAQAELATAQAVATIEMLPINKKEKQQYIKLLKEQIRTERGKLTNAAGNLKDIAEEIPIIGELLK